MKKKIEYNIRDKKIVDEFTYIPIRYIIAVMISVLEIIAVIGIVILMCYYVPHFYILAVITHFACIIKIIASDDNPDYKVPWLFFVMFIPIAGFMLYFMFYSRKLDKKSIKRMIAVVDKYAYECSDSDIHEELKSEDARAAAQAKMLTEISRSHLFKNTKCKYYPSGEEMLVDMLADLEGAENFIFMEYFIIDEGEFWSGILDILTRKAAEGLTVRVLYDDIGCMQTLPGNYAKQLQKLGIEAAPFSILRGAATGEFNNRSHRKITVIDGKIGYTGGVNIADEYINKKQRFGHWKDTAVRLEGKAVHRMTKMFMCDFGINAKKLPEPPENTFAGEDFAEERGYLVPFGDGPAPIFSRNVGKTVIQNMLYSATDYVYMTTPYLIIDNDLCTDIENTAMRGVDVRIVVPHIPDKRIVFGITRSFYSRLMSAGVKIYEYEPGFIHAKNYISDDKYAMVGTINLDYRSLVHHFENGVWMYGCDAIGDIKKDLDGILDKSIEITEDKLKTGIIVRFVRAIVRIFAPML